MHLTGTETTAICISQMQENDDTTYNEKKWPENIFAEHHTNIIRPEKHTIITHVT